MIKQLDNETREIVEGQRKEDFFFHYVLEEQNIDWRFKLTSTLDTKKAHFCTGSSLSHVFHESKQITKTIIGRETGHIFLSEDQYRIELYFIGIL
jgi:hypothetical protein